MFRLNTLFEVELPIAGQSDTLFALPAEAVQTGNRIWAVRDGSLREVPARIDRRVGDDVLVLSDALEPGLPILLTRLPNAIEGLRVRDAGALETQRAAVDAGQ